jgi:hypothetical protein
MAIIEQRILSQVNALPDLQVFNVQWTNQIIKDGEIIASSYERKCYTIVQKDEFLVEVTGAVDYAKAIGWPQ